MFGLDAWIAHLSDGTTLLVVPAVAILLGLRHASDPDHLAAVTTLIAGGEERTKRLAARLGLAWGFGHATSLFVFGLPIVLFGAFLPGPVRQGAETVVGVVIVALAVWLLVRWRRGLFRAGPPAPVGPARARRSHGRPRRTRSPLQAYAIGLVHGLGGSGGVGALLLAAIHAQALAALALALFATSAAGSMALLSTGFGLGLASAPVRRSFEQIAPVLGASSLLFGLWYALGALSLAPHAF